MKNNVENRITLNVEGMSCNNCAAGIKKHLENKLSDPVNVNFAMAEVICYTDKNYNLKDIVKTIKSLGYKVSLKPSEKKKNFSKSEIYFVISLIFTLPLFCHMFVSENSILHKPLVQLLLCIPVYFIGIIYFGKSAFYSLKSKVPNMDVLIFVGSSSAFIYSLYGWWLFQNNDQASNYLFFETTATIITLVLFGNVLEHRSVKQTTTAIKDLSKIKYTKAKKLIEDKIEEISYQEIKKDDVLIINKGDQIPVDGQVIWGSCLVDESMITGENIPVNKNEKDEVIGGTILTSGSIMIKAINVGEETIISNIIELVKNAQLNQPKIQKIGDQVSAVFVPIVLCISFFTFSICFLVFNIDIHEALLRAIAVLVISCPCAMGLATPTAIMVGIGKAAKQGILIKGGDTLEKMAKIKNIAFDKTGTLTTGNFKIKSFNSENGNDTEIKNIIYNLEKFSSHPIAKSLVNELASYSQEINFTDIKEKNGFGISGNYNGNIYFIGRVDELKENIFNITILKNNKKIASLKIEDELKENTKKVIEKIKEQGYSTFLISGDKKINCELVNKELKFTEIFYQQLPKEKLQKIEELNNSGPTAMVGDGINDAPALAKAFIGVSLGNASQIAIQSSDVILLNNNNLNQLNKALVISKMTLRTIKQNLFWAFSYNIIAIPIACLGYLNPMWAALFMAFSDVIVVGNSIRLKFKKNF